MQRASAIMFAALLGGCGAAHHEINTVTATGSGMCRSDDACGPGARCVNGACTRIVAVETPTPPVFTPAPSACSLESVYFAFDSSALDSQDATTADHDAACILQHGADGRIVIVGRTDPRGSTEYNLALGERRAATLAHQLERMGIQSHHVVLQSVGSEYATGTDEGTWARDRFAGFDRPR